MHYKKSFPGKFMQAADLDESIIATVKTVINENVGSADAGELKPVVQWREPDIKGVVLNLTRAEKVAELAGSEDMDDWPNTRVLIRKGTTRYQGKKVACIEFAAPPPVHTTPRKRVQAPATSDAVDLGEPFEEPADEVGF